MRRMKADIGRHPLHAPAIGRPGKPALMAAILLALGHALPQRMTAQVTTTETATGTWRWEGSQSDGSRPEAVLFDGIVRRANAQSLPGATLNYGDHAQVTYTLKLVETRPPGDGWVRQGEAPAAPSIRVTLTYAIDVTVDPEAGDTRPSVSVSWTGLGSGSGGVGFTTSFSGKFEGSRDFTFPGPSYTATGDLTARITLPPAYAGSAYVIGHFTYDFDMIGSTGGSATYTRQVPKEPTTNPPSTIPEPREWAMLAGLPLAAFGCARRLWPRLGLRSH